MDNKEPRRRTNGPGHGTDDPQEVAKMHEQGTAGQGRDPFILAARAFEKHAAKLEATDPEKAAAYRRKAARWREGQL